jgi:hypothetical protein
MTRLAHLLSICLVLFALLLSSGKTHASSPTSPCAATNGIATPECTHFRSYLRQLVERWSQYPSTTIPESTMVD